VFFRPITATRLSHRNSLKNLYLSFSFLGVALFRADDGVDTDIALIYTSAPAALLACRVATIVAVVSLSSSLQTS